MSEKSESPSRNGLSHIFSKARNRDTKRRQSISNSVKSGGSDGSRHGLRQSIENTVDRIKIHDEDGDMARIKKIRGKGIGSRRRRKKEEEIANEEAERGRGVADRGTLGNDASTVPYSSSNSEAGASMSSLITYDSEITDPHPEKPLLASQPSHIGYLTTSSPLIQSTSIPESKSAEERLDGAPTPRAGTLPLPIDKVAASESTTSLVGSTLRAPTNGSQRRSPSPVGRLKEALKTRKGSDSSSSPERKSGGGVAATSLKEKNQTLSGENRRGSVSSRLGSLFPDRPASQPQMASATPPLERPRTARINTGDTSASAPSTPPSAEAAPMIVNTPPTPTDAGTNRFPSVNRERGSSDPVATNSNVVTSPSGNMISHRRVRSGSANLGPSKLSNITSAPLTPTPEHPSPGPNSQTGFFSSVFSAAQNAANTLSNSIANTSVAPNNSKVKGATQSDITEVENPEVESLTEKLELEDPAEKKELAVKTLGMGDLSLSHLGISETQSGGNTPTNAVFPDEQRGRSQSTNTNDISLSSSTVLGAPISLADTIENKFISNFDDHAFIRPRSTYEPSAGDRTPPNGSVFEGRSGLQRSGSIRSTIGKRRKRNSSATTGNTIGAAIASANISIANPQADGNTPKITGFAVASKKRNRDFHQLFRSVPDDDYLIEDYSCALQREILAHGRLYVSEGHLCFSSNIFGWVTTLVMSFDEIVSVEKRSTALLFKNGLMISTLHAKNVFASFTSRDSTYDLIVGIWKLGHPSLRSSLNGVRIEETGGGDKTEKYDGKPEGSQSGSGDDSEGESGDEIYDEDEEDEDGESYDPAEGSVAGSDTVEKVVSRKPSAAVVTNGAVLERPKEESPASLLGDFPGPTTHAATECTDGETHYSKIIADELIPAPLGKIYNLMFGAPSASWMRNWLVSDQKCLEVTMDESYLSQDSKVRNYSYIKPLNGAIGPKQTKCLSVENLDLLDLEKAVSVTITTSTPDVPSGNVFSTKTKYCLSWGEGNTTRLQMNCTIEWTGKSWLKGPIEKGANDGQVKHAKDLVASLKAEVSSRRGTIVPTGKGKKKGRKGKESKSISKLTDGASDSKPTSEDWGLLKPVHGILGPVVDIIKPLITGNMMYGLFVGLLVASWFRFGFVGTGNGARDMALFSSPERIAAYEEIWQREESELWEWLEERVGMDRVRDVGSMRVEQQNVNERLTDEKMEERAVDAAIRVTEEKLNVLKQAVEKRKTDVKAKVKGV